MKQLRHSLEFHRLLSSLFLCKFGTLTAPSTELLRASEEHGLDPWFEWMKHIQQYIEGRPQQISAARFFSTGPKLEGPRFFANHERLHDEAGAVYIADITEAGRILHRDLSVGDIFEQTSRSLPEGPALRVSLILSPAADCLPACQ